MNRLLLAALMAATTIGLTLVGPASAQPSTCRGGGRWACPTPAPTATLQPTPAPTVAPTATPVPTAAPTPVPPTGLLQGASIYHKNLSDLDLAVQAGLDSVRIVNWIDDESDPFNASRWSLVDSLVAGAKARGLSVILDLSTYRNHLLNRGVNPYTADWGPMLQFVANRYDASEVTWLALAGEPEAPNGGTPGRPTATELTGFYQTAAVQWRSMSSIPVEPGGLLQYGWNSGIDWQAIFDATQSCAVHVYSQNDIDYLPTMDAFCDARGYPFLLEEFGQPSGVGDANRAAYFQSIYDLAAARGMSVLFWNLGTETNGDSHDVNPNTPQTWAVVKAN